MYTMSQEGNALVYRYDGEVLSVEPWGANSFRVRSTILGELEDTDYALLKQDEVKAEITVGEYRSEIVNGKIRAVLEVSNWSKKCDISFYNQNGKLLLKEAGEGGALNKKNRFFKPIIGGDFHLTVTFASEPKEKLFGSGLWLPVAQSGCRPCELCLQHHRVVCGKHKADGLLDYRRGYAG